MALPWREKWLYAGIACCLIAVKVGLYLLPFERLHGWVARCGQSCREPTKVDEVHVIVQAIERVARFLSLLWINCLPQALIGHMLLHRKGFDVQLKIGVRKNPDDRLAAHAWLEYRGRVVLGDLCDLRQFVVFPSLDVLGVGCWVESDLNQVG